MRLAAENLGAERGGEPVFGGVDFALGAGDGLVVTGPNGAGKTTLLRVVAGLLPAATGTVRLEGGEETGLAAACHFLGHRNAMKDALTVGENLAFWRDFLGERRLGIDEALERVGLEALAALPYGYLSAGQRRRAAIARLMVSHRPIWLLDEPTSALDASSSARFAGLMKAHLGDGGIVIAATHQPLELEGAAALSMGKHPSSPQGGG